MSSSGSTTFPFDFDILAPSLMTMPWVRRFWNGSPPFARPGARGALVVEEVEDRVLDPADVLVHRHPVVDGLGIRHPAVVLRRAIPEEIPRGLDEGVHRVGVAAARPPAARAPRVHEGGAA